MDDNERALVEQLERESVERRQSRPAPLVESPSVHFTDLPQSPPDSPIAAEWDLYCRDVGRLLAEGHEGRWALIKGEKIIGIWDTEEEADQVRLHSFLMQPVLLKQICVRERVLRGGGHDRRWRSSEDVKKSWGLF
jgi:hypothetical protein